MEEKIEVAPARKPKHTRGWLGQQCIFVLVITFILACIPFGISDFASDRVSEGLLHESRYLLLSKSVVYCFAIISITLMSLMLLEVAMRKNINNLQYTLIALAQTVFYLLLLSIAEKLSFSVSYVIVTAMTVGLIAWFVNEITHSRKFMAIAIGIIIAEYGLMFLLIKLGTMALLVGSILLFLLIALAMFFTVRLKEENQELIIK